MAENILQNPMRRTESRSESRALSLPRIDSWVWLVAILLVGSLLRFVGIAWDETYHLHPDERFMTMVETAIRVPENLSGYFNTATSSLSPYNNNFGLYVYGTFPLYLVKAVGQVLDKAGYDQINLVGRALSALFDVGTIAATALVGRRLYGAAVGLVAGGLYALMALPIQQAHFFTVDSYASFFAVLAAYLAIRIGESNSRWDYLALGAVVGFGIACKISMFVLGGFAALGAIIVLYRAYERERVISASLVESIAVRLLLSGIVAILTFRVLQPIAFQGPTILNFTPNEQWLANMAEVRGLQSGERDFPPGHQWTDRPAIWFPWSNMVLWGMGLPLGLAAWIGWAFAAFELIRRRKIEHFIPVVFIGIVFLYQGTQWVKSMRYFLHIYPFLAMTAAYLLHRMWMAGRVNGAVGQISTVSRAIVLGIVGLTALYAIGFTSIYTRPHSRVDASRWIYDNVPRGAAIANEHWDDPLPLRLDGRDGFGGYYRGLMLNNYDEDTPKKLDELVANLVQADYLVLSSNRLYDSIPRLPMRYPMTTRYYELLFAEQIGFHRVAEFTSYPSILGISLPDQSAEEAWSVYDHPKVTIFQKTSDFDPARVLAQLGGGIDWDGILRLRPDQATKVKTGLMLSPSDQTTYQASGTWRELFSTEGISNRFPLVAWWLAIQVVGLAALPIIMVACRSLVDRGWAIAKPLGLLLVAWLAWMAASLHLAEFGPSLIFASLGVVAIVSSLVLAARGRDVPSILRARWRIIALEEALFTVAFLGFVAVRAANPDIWHPVMGGEKPMDFAYLNAVIKSAYFPPYDPWFAGGFINYYYFGFVLVAGLVHLTGVVPGVAYNLAVPTFFAATLVGAFAVALNLVQRLPGTTGRSSINVEPTSRAAVLAGVAASLGVAVMGNLGELQLLLKGLHDIGRTVIQLPFLTEVLRVTDGLRMVIGGGKTLPFRTEWWYWNATRVIDHPQGEAVPITEFPYFTFLYGDLHAHMMALPFTLVCLVLIVSVLRTAPDLLASRRGVGTFGFPWLAATLLALVIGALWPLNTWDFPTFALLAGAALLLRAVALNRGMSARAISRSAVQWLLVMVAAYALFLPFHRSYVAGYSSIELWQGSRTGLDAYLIVHGIFLFVIVTALIAGIAAKTNRAPLAREVRLLFSQGYRLGALRSLDKRLVRRRAMQRLGLGALASLMVVVCGLLAWKVLATLMFPVVPAASLAVVAVPLLVLALTAVLLFDGSTDARRRFTYTCIALGAALTIAVEVIVLKGDISRMNTVFKFYLQVWTLWSIAAATLLPELLGVARGVTDSIGRARPQRLPNLPGWWRPAFAALIIAGLLYPIFATYVRAQDRFEHSTEFTLDGMAYMDEASYNDKNQPMELKWDRDAIEWMQATIDGSPVIVEAVTPLYHWGSRVSIYTGLPTIIGWDWHQKQQRALLPGEVVDRRINDVNQIFGSATAERTRELLERYRVRYLYVGQQERLYYPGVEVKMRRNEGNLWNRVYENQEVSIYEVRRP